MEFTLHFTGIKFHVERNQPFTNKTMTEFRHSLLHLSSLDYLEVYQM